MPTIKEVARLAGVSIGTVSHVITRTVPVSPALRLKVEAAIQQLDYHPNYVARSLKTSKTRTVGIIVPDMTVSFFPRLILGAEAAARQRGYSIVATNSYESPERQRELLALLRSQRVEGILLVVAAGQMPVTQITKLLEAGVPMVSLDRIPDRVRVDTVSVDNIDAAEMGVKHLIEMGYRRIALVTGPLALKNERHRLLGYRRAFESAGLPVSDTLVWNGNLMPADVAALCSARLRDPQTRPDAIFSTNGPSGLGVLRALQSCGLETPRDVGLITFDELTVDDLFSPAVTTVVQPAFEIGFRASEILLDRIEGTSISGRLFNVRLPATLKIRDSTRPKIAPVQGVYYANK